jgi:redox-sensitive bicupin YhaK (pirin superfamily)
MSTLVLPRKEQVCGILYDRNVYECKVIGLPEENGKIKAYSNLFYFSYVWSEKGGKINEHTHYSFDVLALVLKGEVLHNDSKNKKQIKQAAGDLMLIHAGNFVSHSERLSPGTEYLQIWIDPDIDKTLTSPNAYENYVPDLFPVLIEQGRITKIYSGEGSPFDQISENTIIKDVTLSYKLHKFEIAWNKIMSVYVIEGEIEVEEFQLKAGDFFLVKNQEEVIIMAKIDSRILVMESPNQPNYKTYAEKFF